MYLTGKAYLMVIIIFHITLLFYFPILTKYFVDHLAHLVPELTYVRSLFNICRPILLFCVLKLCFKAQLYKESYHQCQKMWKLSSSLEHSRWPHINSVPSAIESPQPWGQLTRFWSPQAIELQLRADSSSFLGSPNATESRMWWCVLWPCYLVLSVVSEVLYCVDIFCHQLQSTQHQQRGWRRYGMNLPCRSLRSSAAVQVEAGDTDPLLHPIPLY